MKAINVKRTTVTLLPDRRRVLARPFRPMSDQRSVKICARVMALPESEVHALLEQVRAEFGERHPKVREFLKRQFDEVRPYLLNGQRLSEERELLLGGYFTHEFSLEAAALFNPSIVPHPNQSDLPPGSLRFILSLRATAEGHVSSITFRTGRLDANNNIRIDTPARYSLEPVQVPNAIYEKRLFERKLQELGLVGDFNREVLKGLGDAFTLEELRTSVSFAVKQLRVSDQETQSVARETLMLAQSNYEVQFRAGLAFVRTRIVPRHTLAEQRDRGRPLCSISKRRRHGDLLRDLHGLRRQDDPAAIPRDIRLSSFQIHHAEWPGRGEQGHGALPTKDQRPLRDAGPAGCRKHLPDVLRPSAFLAHHAACFGAVVPLGIHPDRQLRLADRNRRRLARDQPWSGTDAQILHWRFPPRSRRPTKVIGRLREPLIGRTKTNAKATSPTSFIPAAVFCMADN